MNTLNNLIIEGNLLKKKLETNTFKFTIEGIIDMSMTLAMLHLVTFNK